MFSQRIKKRFASFVRPPARHPQGGGLSIAGLRAALHPRSTLPPPQRSSLRFSSPSATVAAWYPGPAAPFQGKASIPPVFISTGSGASVRRDLPGSVSACVHPCPKNGGNKMFSTIFFGVNRPGFVPRRSGSRLVILTSPKLQQEAATAPEMSVTVAARSAPHQFSPASPPTHPRKSHYV